MDVSETCKRLNTGGAHAYNLSGFAWNSRGLRAERGAA